MNVVTSSVTIRAPKEKVFAAYVEHIDEWWPRQGVKYRFTFAPREIDPKNILFEPKLGGAFYEIFADGTRFDIGRITEWSPPDKFAYTWKDPDWAAATLVEVFLKQDGKFTTLTVEHSGFDAIGIPGAAEGYNEGSKEIYATLKAWIEANVEKIKG
jgi:uncharacterized protein YndB with AHSA1/START domain